MEGEAHAATGLPASGEVAHVCDPQLHPVAVRREVLARARGEIVEHAHARAARHQGVDEVGADEAGAAGDEHPGLRPCHSAPLLHQTHLRISALPPVFIGFS